jgi:hypothetical protein
MEDGECTKSFPNEFCPENVMNHNGFPAYQRRDTGQTQPLVRNNKVYHVDNRWVVPYNPYLFLKFNSHINIEFCASIKSIQYLFKYLYKGFDCMETETVIGTKFPRFARTRCCEIKQFQDNRCVSAPEAFWRMSKFPLTYRSHPIIRLAVHLRREQSVFFTPGLEQQAVEKAASKTTGLV